MNELTKTDMQFVLSRLPRDVIKLIEKFPLFVGGGFVRSTVAGERVSDIDIFGPDETTLKLAAQELCLLRKGRIHETQNALTLLSPPRFPVQFIKRWLFTDLVALVESFDFTVCQAAIKHVVGGNPKWVSHCSANFYSDLAAKRLVYTHPVRNEDAGGSILRMRKFLQRGYNIQAPSIAGVIARLIDKLDFERADNEKARAKVITGLLREVDPLAIIDGIDFVDEHEVLQ